MLSKFWYRPRLFLYWLYLLFPIVSFIVKASADNEKTYRLSASTICEDFFLNINMPFAGCIVPTKEKNYSSEKKYAHQSAALIENTLGIKISFHNFHHLPFDIKCSDRIVSGNLFAFEFEDIGKLKELMKLIPNKQGGSYGTLRTKAPQQYQLRSIGPVLVVLVIDGLRRDAVVEDLFEKFQNIGGARGRP